MSHKQLSGIVLSQSQVPGSSDFLPINTSTYRYQEFYLPGDFQRGTDADEQRYPSLTGFQLLTDVDALYVEQASLDWKLDLKLFGQPWQTLATGVTIGGHVDGTSWFDAYFDEEVPINATIATERFRIGFLASNTTSLRIDEVVSYDGATAVVDNVPYQVKLVDGVPYPITHLGLPAYLLYDNQSGLTTFSVRRGITNAWYSVPNPLALLGNAKAYGADGTTALLSGSDEFSFCFRVLGSTADEGVDFLGNRYRSAVTTSASENVSTVTGAVTNRNFLSGPQPSRFAVVSQYFDETNGGEAQTIDSVLLDPITPGMYFHIYYSNDGAVPRGGDGPEAIAEWEEKLWIPVQRTYHATKRDTYVLPEPITAKFVKIEYTYLQAQPYSAGNFEQVIRYKKHPKWVLNYFLARTAAFRAEQSSFIANTVGVTYNALDLAYNYYLDDIRQEPDQPVAAPNSEVQNLERFLTTNTDLSDQVDTETLAKINLSLKPYLNQPALLAKPENSILSAQTFTTAASDVEYPVERDTSTASGSQVPRRSVDVVFEQLMPVMFFYLTCRHRYREVAAKLDNNHAFFAGVREIAFNREHYTIAADTGLYIEAGADFINTERNDFVASDQGLAVDRET